MDTTTTNNHKNAYQTTVRSIKESVENKKKWKQRKWILFFWSLSVIAIAIWGHYYGHGLNLPIILTLFSLIVFIFFVSCPFGEIPEMSDLDIEHAIVRKISETISEQKKLNEGLKAKEDNADLTNENWSEYIQERRNFYEMYKKEAEENLLVLKEEYDVLQMALTWCSYKKKEL